MVSSQPILDENGYLFGGVAVIRDMKTVRQIYQKITGQPLPASTILFIKVKSWKN